MPDASLMDRLRRSGLLSAEHLAELERLPESVHPNPRILGRLLLQRNLLTRFQLNLLAAGRADELRIGPYLLLERLGEGGMGKVYKARGPLQRVVALKVMRKEKLASADAVTRFHKEVRAAAQLNHPNIVTAFDAGLVGQTLFLAMEYVDGPDLARLVKENGPLPLPHACEYARQAALALQHAHERGLVHRDVKPANLLLSSTGTVKLLDLGLARLEDADQGGTNQTRLGQVLGSPDYLAPEQALDARSVDHRADLYGLGCTLLSLLTGRAPFQAKSLQELILKHHLEPPPTLRSRRPDAPAELEALLARLLAKKPEQRPQSAAEVAQALLPFCRAAPPPPLPPPPPQWMGPEDPFAGLTEHDRPRPRRREALPYLLGGVAAALLLLVGLVAGFLAMPGSPGKKEPPAATRHARLRPLPALAVAGGRTEEVDLVVERAHGEKALRVRFSGLPPGVRCPDLAVPPGEDTAPVTAQLSASLDVAAGSHTVTVSLWRGDEKLDEQEWPVTTRPFLRPRLGEVPSIRLTCGRSLILTVPVQANGNTDTWTLAVSELPPGVTHGQAPGAPVPGAFRVQLGAAGNAKPGPGKVRLVLRAGGILADQKDVSLSVEAPPAPPPPPPPSPTAPAIPAPLDVKIPTGDGLTLAGTFYASPKGTSGSCVLMLHDVRLDHPGRKQDDWVRLALLLQKQGCAVLTFDFRGYGDNLKSKEPVEPIFGRLPANMALRDTLALTGVGRVTRMDQLPATVFLPGYLPWLVQDVVAARLWLDLRHDEGKVNSSSLLLVGEGEGAHLGAIWLATEARRHKVGTPDVPESRDVCGAVWISPVATFRGQRRPGTATVRKQLAGEKAWPPMLFLFNREDPTVAAQGRNWMETYRQAAEGVGGARVVRPPESKDARSLLAGTGVMGMVGEYVRDVTHDRAGTPWAKRGVVAAAYTWQVGRRTSPAKAAGKTVPGLAPLDRWGFTGLKVP